MTILISADRNPLLTSRNDIWYTMFHTKHIVINTGNNMNNINTSVSTSESVSIGHPDSTCDGIVAYITDRYLSSDPMSKVALECQFKDQFITLSGEVTSSVEFSSSDIEEFVRDAVAKIGYTDEYQKKFGHMCVSSDKELEIVQHIYRQSPDISQGVVGENAGWGDQGIYWGMATKNEKFEYLPKDYYIARLLARRLFDEVRESDSALPNAGLDIKTQVTIVNDEPKNIVVAIPSLDDIRSNVTDIVLWTLRDTCGVFPIEGLKIVINGTGKYTIHSSVGDCGTTGRKLAVNFYGGNCRIGGGAVFGKDPSKSDVTLNCYARYIARKYMNENDLGTTFCSISGCIGKPEIRISIYDEKNCVLDTWVEDKRPDEIINLLKLREPKWFSRCWYGLFGNSHDSL